MAEKVVRRACPSKHNTGDFTEVDTIGVTPAWANLSLTIGSFLVSLLAVIVSCLAREHAKVAADAAKRVAEIEGNRRHEECGPKRVRITGRGVERNGTGTGALFSFVVLENGGDRSYRYGGFAVCSDGTKHAIADGDIFEGGAVKIWLGEQKLAFDRVNLWFDGDCWCPPDEGSRGHWKKTFALPSSTHTH